MSLSRRQTLGIMAAGGLAACSHSQLSPETASKLKRADDKVFLHGVASGDPKDNSVIIWTRVSGQSEAVTVLWELSQSRDFSEILQSGEKTTSEDKDFTVKVDPNYLEAGKTYFYRFKLGETYSPIGRTKTLPLGQLDKLGIALASCSNYAFGFFNAYDAIAKDEAIDVVLHTGDYIYEYSGEDGWGHETGKTLGRAHDPKHEIISLEDYRTRHAQYKTDEGSLAMHAAHPLICIWDDHESANNPWKEGAQNHTPETEGVWGARRDASVQAYYEWMPIREPEGDQSREEAWRTYVFGDLASLITMECRHTGRDQQVDYLQYVAEITSIEARNAFMADVMNDPKREMISERMKDVLKTNLGKSTKNGEPWRVIGNSSPIARMLVPDVSSHGITPSMNKDPASLSTQALFWKGKWNLPFYTDTWDGYPVARENLYQLSKSVGANDLLFLTGDSHSFWANSLKDGEGNAMGIEIGTAGISSPGDFLESGWPEDVAEKLDRIFAQNVEDVKWTTNLYQGYVRVVLTKTQAISDFVSVDTVLSTDYKSKVIHSETILRHSDSIAFLET